MLNPQFEPKYDWDALFKLYCENGGKLKPISREKCQDSAQAESFPPYETLRQTAHRKKWKQLYEQGRQQIEKEELGLTPIDRSTVAAQDVLRGAGIIVDGTAYEVTGDLGERYKKAISDPELLALQREIALVNARLHQLSQRINTHESTHAWQSLKKLIDKLLKAQRENDPKAGEIFTEIFKLVVFGDGQERIWVDIVAMQDHLRKLVESERRRLMELQQYTTAEQVLSNQINPLIAAVKRHVDTPTLALIAADYARGIDPAHRR